MASDVLLSGPMLAQRETAYANVLARATARQNESRQRDLRTIRRATAQRFKQQRNLRAQRWAR